MPREQNPTHAARLCGNCAWWLVWGPVGETGLHGRCRRMPPTIRWGSTDSARSWGKGDWPLVHHHDWCGEFQPKKTAA